MVADLRQVFSTTACSKEFNYYIPCSAFPDNNSYMLDGNVLVSGSFYNRADVVHMDYSVKFTLNIVCDRCLKEMKRDYSFEFKRIVVKTVNSDNDEYTIAENDKVDVDEIALSDLILSVPTKLLCRDDCAGLCPVCGCDRNESECNCQNK